ncbi:PREDICTED: uncharacterized protein LOC105448382 [Wasmannia auropunctata]|uniref:uncharacterized protein LOC105448382 n=1 Tax=Wasmannia auropunctata TaxID=64793 RepID=UPI0005F081FA|nr:PREDICTED: uncharacterized protein LOC105448382 [Wasmannia auropunctata]
MQQVSYCLGFSQSLTPVYHPEANPVEQKNRDMKTQLSILVGDTHTEWANKLPSIRYTMNSSTSLTTRNTPAYLTFARELRNPGDIQRDLRDIVIGENFVSEVTPYLLKIADTMKEVIETHEREQDRRKSYADKDRRPAIKFKEGDHNYGHKTRILSDASKKITVKFAPKRDGPYKINKRISPTSYQLADNNTGEVLSIHHVSDLEAYKGNNSRNSPCQSIKPIRKRGRPKKETNSSLNKDIRPSSRVPDESKGGVTRRALRPVRRPPP